VQAHFSQEASEKMIVEQRRQPNIALLFDCENVGLGNFDVEMVLRWLAPQGRISIKRAYGDWTKSVMLRSQMLLAAVELVEMPSEQHGKNRADIRMVVDAMEMAFAREHIDTFVIASGDSDFIPLISRLREYGRQVWVVARRENRSRYLAAACDSLTYFDEIATDQPSVETRMKGASTLLETSLKQLKGRDERLSFSNLKRAMRLNEDQFCHTRYGYKTFKEFVFEMDPALETEIRASEAAAKLGPTKSANCPPPKVIGAKSATPPKNPSETSSASARSPEPGGQEKASESLSEVKKNGESGSERSLKSSTTKSPKPSQPPLSNALLDHIYWAVSLLEKTGRNPDEPGIIQNAINGLFPRFKLVKFGIPKAAGYRKLFTLMEMEGWCELDASQAKKTKAFQVRFLGSFFDREVRLGKPENFDKRVDRYWDRIARLPGPTIPNPFPLPSFARPQKMEQEGSLDFLSSESAIAEPINDEECEDQSFVLPFPRVHNDGYHHSSLFDDFDFDTPSDDGRDCDLEDIPF
jgi:uncharacterized protein (TIGR00288 family)